jgi:hypothetical protein
MPAIRALHPQTYNGDLASPPPALTPLCLKPNWVTWCWQRSKGDGWTKPPCRVDNPAIHAANNDPSSWGSRSDAVKAVTAGKAHGVGFCLTGTNIAAIDIDKCRNAETGAIDDWAQKLLDISPNTYVEVTVSGTGLRIIGTADGPETHRRFNTTDRKGAGVEVYRGATRYITVSGLQHNRCNELANIDALINGIVAEHDIADNTEKMKAADDGGHGFDDIDHLIRNGAPETQRSEAFARCVWSLAGCGLSADEIEEELCRYPNGIMAKYAKRLRREIDRCYTKWQARQTASLDAEQTQELIDDLAKRWGWIREDTIRTGVAGRPRRRWRVNPNLFSKDTAGIAGNAGIPAKDTSDALATNTATSFRNSRNSRNQSEDDFS